MRVLILDTHYPRFLERLYRQDSWRAGLPYREQWRALMATRFGTSDSYSHHLRGLGHDAEEVIVNCAPLQEAWRREHPRRRRPFRRTRPFDVLRAQVDEFEPDVLFVQDIAALPVAILDELRGKSRLLVGQTASGPPPPGNLRALDLVITSLPNLADGFRAQGLQVEELRLGFDPRLPAEVPAAERRSGAVFVGALAGAQWTAGTRLLEEAASFAPIEFWGYGAEALPTGSPVLATYRGEAWGLDMYGIVGRAAIVVNRHTDISAPYANNMRLYEATGMGAMLLTEDARNLPALFVAGREVVTYRTGDELARSVRHYLAHDEERAAIAQAGRQRTLREHTYGQRMRELAGLLADRLS